MKNVGTWVRTAVLLALAAWWLTAVLDSSSQPNLLAKARHLDDKAFGAEPPPNENDKPGSAG